MKQLVEYKLAGIAQNIDIKRQNTVQNIKEQQRKENEIPITLALLCYIKGTGAI